MAVTMVVPGGGDRILVWLSPGRLGGGIGMAVSRVPYIAVTGESPKLARQPPRDQKNTLLLRVICVSLLQM